MLSVNFSNNHKIVKVGLSMKQLYTTYLKKNLFILVSIFSSMIFTGYAVAGDNMMQQNCKNLSELTAKWSNQLNSGKITPEAQAKLAELLAETSQILQEMSEKSGKQMHIQNSIKIQKMEKEWKPFDTSDRM
jgi:hypothetical protein